MHKFFKPSASLLKTSVGFGIAAATLTLAACGITMTPPTQQTAEDTQAEPYSLIGKITVKDGTRAEFTALLSSVLNDSDCISCRLIADKSDPNVLWVSETWASEAAHDDALKTPKGLAALKRGGPMIVKMQRMADTGD